VSSSDLQYILIRQYIDTVNEYHNTILYLENCDTENTLIEQSVTAILKYITIIQWSLFTKCTPT